MGGEKEFHPPPKKKKSITTQQQTKFRFESCLVFVFMMTWEGSAVSWLVPGEKSEPVADRLSHKSNTSVTVRTSMGMWVGLRGRRCWGLLSPFRQHVWHQRGFFFFFKDFHHSMNMRNGNLVLFTQHFSHSAALLLLEMHLSHSDDLPLHAPTVKSFILQASDTLDFHCYGLISQTDFFYWVRAMHLYVIDIRSKRPSTPSASLPQPSTHVQNSNVLNEWTHVFRICKLQLHGWKTLISSWEISVLQCAELYRSPWNYGHTFPVESGLNSRETCES